PECQGFGVHGVVDDSADITVFSKAACPVCHGSRLQPFASSVTFLGRGIADLTSMNVDEALAWLANDESPEVRTLPRNSAATSGGIVDAVSSNTQAGSRSGSNSFAQLLNALSPEARLVADRTLPDIRQRLRCLQQVGLGYLTLDRPTRTLSGGEFQRARLAACLGTGLHGACFVLDEPTTGLHPRDTRRLLQTLFEIRDRGATVVVVEHDSDVIRNADWLVDLGPGAGADGGRLLYSGRPGDAIPSGVDTPTMHCLTRASSSQTCDEKNSPNNRDGAEPPFAAQESSPNATAMRQRQLFPGDEALKSLTIRNARLNNLKNVTVDIPLRALVCVTGVSGSGKTSLIMDTLLPVAAASLRKDADPATTLADVRCGSIDGLQEIARVVSVDNSPLGRNRRSNIATYSGLWDHIRKVLARTRDARARGFAANRFSFNSGDGRCAECRGTGLKDIRMNFLPNATVPCPACHGRRFNQSTLTVRFAGLNAADILNLRVDQALNVFREFDSLRSLLKTFHDVGLGYLTLGQPASTFSGGESQRVRLATELASQHAESTLYILDEPTTGLHAADVSHLLLLFRSLVDAGHSVIVIEHNTDVMRSADWLIDIGPDSADSGGQIVYIGPAAIAADAPGFTGDALRHENSLRNGTAAG
ncbi:MAG: hypothetical protein KDA89_13960, partial [Planctomycetaceae bacterium]|nr:hypothetical protein [Planctomycetaceae bacterium]